MKRTFGLFLTVVMIMATVVTSMPPQVQAQSPSLTVILSAYSYLEDGKWLGESGSFFEAMGEAKKEVSDLSYCDKAFIGEISGQPVLVITMGTAKIETALCAMDLIKSPYWERVKEIVWVGISGFSPTVGGFIPGAEYTMPGDVCIMDVVGNWDLTFSDLSGGEGPIFWPMDWPNSAQDSTTDKALTDELWAASQQVVWPSAPPEVVTNVLKYFPALESVRLPKVFRNCGEPTSDMFYHDKDSDAYCRLIIANLTGTTPDKVVCVTAMEIISVATAIDETCRISGECKPLAALRASSNYDMTYDERVSAKKSIDEGMNIGKGAPYGCVTGALPVLKMLELRSK